MRLRNVARTLGLAVALAVTACGGPASAYYAQPETTQVKGPATAGGQSLVGIVELRPTLETASSSRGSP